MVNPLLPNGFSHLYQLDESISNFRALVGSFHFYSNFKRKFFKQTVENLIRRRVLWRLIWLCTVCRCLTKRALVDIESIIRRERAQRDDDLRDDFTKKLNHALSHVCFLVSAYCLVDTATSTYSS